MSYEVRVSPGNGNSLSLGNGNSLSLGNGNSFIPFSSILFAAGLTEQIKLDRYLHPHFRYYMREVRTVVYSQFLESYKSVTIEAMAKAFGVTVDFIDL
jgi:hypothetical protein